VTGVTALGGTDFFANAGSADAYFSLTVPANAVSLDVSTCDGATTFDTFLTLLPGCLRGNDDGSVVTSKTDLIQDNDDSACDQAGTGNGCSVAFGFVSWGVNPTPTPCPAAILTSPFVEAFRASHIRVAYPAAGT
jgi:hypothetical protein